MVVGNVGLERRHIADGLHDAGGTSFDPIRQIADQMRTESDIHRGPVGLDLSADLSVEDVELRPVPFVAPPRPLQVDGQRAKHVVLDDAGCPDWNVNRHEKSSRTTWITHNLPRTGARTQAGRRNTSWVSS